MSSVGGSSASPQDVRERILSVDWDFGDAPLPSGRHDLHGYPARFIPEVARALIEILTRPGHTVLDPFCGSGTVVLEALGMGRCAVGIDANPFAALLARVKVACLDPETTRELARHLGSVSDRLPPVDRDNEWRPQIPNVDKWYSPEVFEELVGLRGAVVLLTSPVARDVAMLAFAGVAAKMSFQDSETRYVSRPRAVALGDARQRYISELRRMIGLLKEDRPRMRAPGAEIRLGDSRDPASYAGLPSDSVDAVISSPPYPNAFDYHLYHRFRLFWMGDGPYDLRQSEIGSHLRGQAMRDPEAVYLDDMTSVLNLACQTLKPEGLLSLVVGDGLFNGTLFRTAHFLRTIGGELGFEHVVTAERQLPQFRRSMTAPGRRLREEQVLVMRRLPDSPRSRAPRRSALCGEAHVG